MNDQKNNLSFSNEEIQENKVMGIIAYIIFFIPLLVSPAKESAYVRFHVNQGLILFLAGVVNGIIRMIPILGSIVSLVLSLLIFILWIIGIVNAIQGRAVPLPIIGSFKLIS